MGLPLFMREWIVISGMIFFGTVFFYFFLREKRSLKWGFLVFAVNTAGYFSPDFLVFISIIFILFWALVPKWPEALRVGFALLLFSVFPINYCYSIPFPGINYLIVINYPRMVNLFILLPICLKYLFQAKNGRRLFFNKLDKYVVLFMAYVFFFGFRDTTFTDTFRVGINMFIDYFIPYFAISRAIRNTDDFKEAFRMMMFAAFILALIGIFETFKRWHMYDAVFLGTMGRGFHGYGMRFGLVRATTTFFPIPFGVYLCIMAGFALFLRSSIDRRYKRKLELIFMVLSFALLCTLSRGPLVGYFILMALFVFFSKSRIIRFIPAVVVLSVIFSLTPIGRNIVASLPFAGSLEQDSINARKKLWENSLPVIMRSPILGSNKYLETPEMQEMRTGEGIIDIVNSYLRIMLHYGLVGLFLFLLIFANVLYSLRKSFLRTTDKEAALLGKILFSALFSFIIMIVTVSMVDYLPYYMWIILGLCAAFIHITAGRKMSL